jgi:hypothetical protein
MRPTQPGNKNYFSVLGQRLNVNLLQPELNILPFHRLQFRIYHGQLRLKLRVLAPEVCLSLRGLIDLCLGDQGLDSSDLWSLAILGSPQKAHVHSMVKRPPTNEISK